MMRRWILVVAVLVAVPTLAAPAGAQDEGTPPTPRDAEIIAGVEDFFDGFSCPTDAEFGPGELADPQTTTLHNGQITAVDSPSIRCTWGSLGINVQFQYTTTHPGRICDGPGDAYEERGRRYLGRPRDPLAITADFLSRDRDDPEGTAARFETMALEIVDQVAPIAETCPTPPPRVPIDAETGEFFAQVDAVMAEECVSIQEGELPGIESGLRLFGIEDRGSMVVIDENGDPAARISDQATLVCSYRDGAGWTASAWTQPVSETLSHETWAENHTTWCGGPTQVLAPLGVSVEVRTTGGSEQFADELNARAMRVAEVLSTVAIDCDAEYADIDRYLAEQAASPPMEPIDIQCPAVPEMEIGFVSVIDGVGPHPERLGNFLFSTYGGLEGSCQWQLPPDDDGLLTSLTATLHVVPEGQPVESAAKLCAAEDFELGERTLGRFTSDSAATMVEIRTVRPTGDTIAIGTRVAGELLATGESFARTCADVPDASIDSLLTPLPDHLADAIEQGAEGRFAVAAPLAVNPPSDPADDSSAGNVSASNVSAGNGVEDPWYALPLRIARVAMLVVSLLALLVAFLVVRKPTRVRPLMERLRIGFTLASAGVMFFVFAAGAPAWAIAGAIVAGGLLGMIQGNNLVVKLTEKGLYAQRSALAIAAFAAGLVLTQVAGLLNRTGAISLGIALSFLSAALAAGVIVGRRPAVAQARAAGTVGIIVLLGAAIIGPGTIRSSSAQEGVSEGEEFLNQAVAWDSTTLFAGLTGEGLEVAIPVGLRTPPEPMTRELVDATTGFASSGISVTGSETFGFTMAADGICCDVTYSAQGTVSKLFPDGWVEEGLLDVADIAAGTIRPFGAQSFFGPSGTVYGETKPLADGSCGRPVSEQAEDSPLPDRLQVDTLNDSIGLNIRQVELYAPCGWDVDLADAADVTPEPPPAGDESRQAGGRVCPVNQEVIDGLGAASAFPGADTATMQARFVRPNAPACSGFGLTFGDEAPGGTRHELTYYLEPGPEGDLADFQTTGDEYLNFLPRNEQVDLVCDVDAAGLPVDTTGGECEYTSFHEVGDGTVSIHTDYTTADGPNVYVRAVFPSGIYRYRCHHCEPGDPAIADFVQSATALAQFGADDGTGGVGALDEAAENVDPDARADGGTDDDDFDNETAAAAALVALLGSLGISATALAESGIGLRDLLGQLSDEERDALLRGDGAGPNAINGPDGEPLPIGPDGTVEFWDDDLGDYRSLPADEAQRVINIQQGTIDLFDPRLGRAVYFGSEAEREAYAADLARWQSADFHERAEADWTTGERAEAWRASRQADADAMRRDRELIEGWEQAQERRRDQVHAGVTRIAATDEALAAEVAEAQAQGDLQALEEIYSDWLYDQMGEHRAEFAAAQRDANLARAGELVARGVGAAARSGMVVVGGPLGVAYTAAGLATISGVEEGYTAYHGGADAMTVVQRTGFGVMLGVRDATIGRLGQMPGMHPAGTAYLGALGDYGEAYTRGVMDGMTHEQALAAARTAYATSVVSEVVGAGFDAIPPGLARDAGQMGTTMVIGGTSAWLGGGDFTDGALDAGAGFLGGRAGGSMGDSLSRQSSDLRDAKPPRLIGQPDVQESDAAIANALADNRARTSGTVPYERQGESVRSAYDQRRPGEIPPATRMVVGDDGVARRVPVGGPARQVEVSDQRTVLRGLTETADSRTGKQAPADIQAVIINTRNQIYAETDAATINSVLGSNPTLGGRLQPGDSVQFDTFSTPGKTPSLGADRDARLVIVRPDPSAPDGQRLIEVPRDLFERQAYSDFAARAQYLAGDEGFSPRVNWEIEQRIEHDGPRLRAEGWTEPEIRARAISEAHNQLFTDRTHAEASAANSDQVTQWTSAANVRTVEQVTPQLRAAGIAEPGDGVTMRSGPDGPEMVVTSGVGEEFIVPRDIWEPSHTAARAELGDTPVKVPSTTPAEALAAANRNTTLSDPRGYAAMWEEKSRFYAGYNETEAVAQSQKGIAALAEIREGYRRQGYELPPISAADQRAMEVVLAAPVGVNKLPDGEVTRRLQEVYGDPDMTLDRALGRLAMNHEMLGLARPATGPPPAPGTVTSGQIMRGAIAVTEQATEEDR